MHRNRKMKLLGILLASLIMLSCTKSGMTEQPKESQAVQRSGGESNGIPAQVTMALKAKFPKAGSVSWDFEDGNYEAAFTLGENKLEAEFDKTGKWLLTEKKINVNELPKTVTDVLKIKYPGYSIEGSESINSAEYGEAYEIEIEKGENTLEIVVNKSGQLLKESVEEENENQEGDNEKENE